MRRALLVVVILALGVGCGDDDPEPARPELSTEHAGPIVPSVEGWTDEAPPASMPCLVVGEDDIHLASGDPIVVLEERRVRAQDRQGGGTGFLISPLLQRLEPLRGQPIALAIDPETPFRTVSEVVFTLGQSQVVSLRPLVRESDRPRSFELRNPFPRTLGSPSGGDAEQMPHGRLNDPDSAFSDVLAGGHLTGGADDVMAQAERVGVQPPDDRHAEGSSTGLHPSLEDTPGPAPQIPVEGSASLNLVLTVTADGIIVEGSGGRLTPGCEEIRLGRGVTVPLRDGRHDFAALQTCLERVEGVFPAEDRVIVSADPEVLFRDVAQAVVTARGTEAHTLFPLAFLSPGVR